MRDNADGTSVYPVVFRIGTFEITSFGLFVALGALAGLWVLQRELRRSGLPEAALDAAVAGLVGGFAGAKLLWTAEHVGEAPLASLLFSRGGLSWFGGFAGGLGAGLAYMRLHRVPVLPVLSAATPALAIGHALGRVGCFLVGDDYGRPTSLPWGVAFPEGLPPTTERVHPTQLYEAVVLVPLALLLLRWRRAGVSDRIVLGRYLVAVGVLRFAIEFIRVNERVLGPLTVAHVAALVTALAGVTCLVVRTSSRGRPRSSSGRSAASRAR
ncbi:MAG: prolipoprotein diacylglyceryl transferase [Acidobacteria bacterium]|nr:prolipoprotein diacylglyceryl transferase [Acidobacteriota bacterium]